MTNHLTEDQFKRVLPTKLKGAVNGEMVATINEIVEDPVIREAYRDNLLSYTNVMKDGKFKIQQYLDAVRYVSFKLFGSSNVEAYCKTFPDRYQRMLDKGDSQKTISSYVNAYKNNKLVNLIMEQTLVPTYILNAEIHQDAINTQAHLMRYANSEKVRSDAANSLLTHLKKPETSKIELDVTVKEDSVIDELRQTTKELAKQQREMITSGTAKPIDVAESSLIIDVESIEVIEES